MHCFLCVLQRCGPNLAALAESLHRTDSCDEWKNRRLRVLEMLLAAGHRLLVYHNVVVPPGTQPVAVFDPLRDRPGDFRAKQGQDRHVIQVVFVTPAWGCGRRRAG